MKRVWLLPLVSLLIVSCERTPPKTSADASAYEVPFLKLPPSASEIRFWDDGHNRIASFKIPESEFRAVFPSVDFSEITKPMFYSRYGFGDPEQSPINHPDFDMTKATSGIYYEKIEDDGGGPTIIYDRDSGVGSYNFAPW